MVSTNVAMAIIICLMIWFCLFKLHHPLSHPVKALGWCVLPLQVQLFCYWVELSTERFQSRGFVASHQVYKIFMKLLQVKFPVASSNRQKLFWVSEFRVDQHGCLPYSLCTGQTVEVQQYVTFNHQCLGKLWKTGNSCRDWDLFL